MSTVGIVGDGQLSRMLAQAALRAGHRPVVLAASDDAPAALPGVELIVGGSEAPHEDPGDLDRFLERCQHVTIENEFLDTPVLEAALARHPSVTFRPSPPSIRVAQDKLSQKHMLAHLGLPTARWEPLAEGDPVRELARVASRFPDGAVLKWARFGYDGRGNHLAPGPADLQAPAARDFVRCAQERGVRVYVEERIDFELELAMVLVRGADGDHEFFPLVVSHQEDGICKEVLGPATRLGHEARLEEQAASMMRDIGAHLGLVGAFAVEFFLCRDGSLLVNEMAPRVHNSGHYTLWRAEPSQFDLHVAAVCGQPLPRPSIEDLRVMRNLLGPADPLPACPTPPPPPEGVELHWYDKREVRPGRKMGHVTASVASDAELNALRSALARYERELWGLSASRATGGDGHAA